MTEGSTRTGRVLRVVQHLRQGHGDKELAAPDVSHAQVDWPAHVLGRLVVLRAHQLAGRRARRAVRADDPPTVRLWHRALEDVLTWDAHRLTAWLAEPRAVTTTCSGADHELLLVGDRLVAPAHGEVDVEAEAVAVALGGRAADCVHLVLRWEQGDPAPEEAARGAGLVSLLRWLSVLRAWSQAGVSPSVSCVAVDRGLTPADLAGHRQAGMSLSQAVGWSAWSPAEAQRWVDLGAEPETAAVWLLQARQVEDAERGVALLRERTGITGPKAIADLVEWARRAGSRPPAEELAAWAASGRSALHWGEVAARGLSHDEAQGWTAAGFSSTAVLTYAHLGLGVQAARGWADAGFGPREAASYAASGLGVLDALALVAAVAEAEGEVVHTPSRGAQVDG